MAIKRVAEFLSHSRHNDKFCHLVPELLFFSDVLGPLQPSTLYLSLGEDMSEG